MEENPEEVRLKGLLEQRPLPGAPIALLLFLAGSMALLIYVVVAGK